MIDTETKIYKNVMEELVDKAIDKEFVKLPKKLAAYLDRRQVATYALNRLPPLYASSEEGENIQKKRARQEMSSEIESAVRHGFAAVRQDPLRNSTPLQKERVSAEALNDYQAADRALKQLRKLLNRPHLCWDNLVEALKNSLDRKTRKEFGRQLRFQAARQKGEAIATANSSWDSTFLR